MGRARGPPDLCAVRVRCRRPAGGHTVRTTAHRPYRIASRSVPASVRPRLPAPCSSPSRLRLYHSPAPIHPLSLRAGWRLQSDRARKLIRQSPESGHTARAETSESTLDSRTSAARACAVHDRPRQRAVCARPESRLRIQRSRTSAWTAVSTRPRSVGHYARHRWTGTPECRCTSYLRPRDETGADGGASYVSESRSNISPCVRLRETHTFQCPRVCSASEPDPNAVRVFLSLAGPSLSVGPLGAEPHSVLHAAIARAGAADRSAV